MSRICPACRIISQWCLCKNLPEVSHLTKIAVIIHKSDAGRSSNTGRLLPMVLKKAQLVLHGVKDESPIDMSKLTQNTYPISLFPGRHAKPLTQDRLEELRHINATLGITMMIPDGNWNQAKHMMNRIPGLSQIPAYELTQESILAQSMRRNIHPGRMSTFEATARVLGLLEGADVEERLLRFYHQFVNRMLMMRGKIKARDIVDFHNLISAPESSIEHPSALSPL